MLKFCRVYFYTSNSSLLHPNCFPFSLYQKPITYMESLLCFDLELHKQEILGIGGLSDCGMVFSLANKNARENACTQEYSA